MLAQEDTLPSIGVAVDTCIRESFAVWRRMHFPGTAGDLAFTDECYKIETNISHFQHGRLDIRVYVHSRKTAQRENFYYRFIRSTGGTLTLEGKA